MRKTWLIIIVSLAAACGDDGDTVLAVQAGTPADQIAADDDGVYWTVSDDNGAWIRGLVDGTTTPAPIGNDQGEGSFIELDVTGDQLVFGFFDGFNQIEYVRAQPKRGGVGVDLFSDDTNGRIRSVVGAAGDAGWGGELGAPPRGLVVRAALDGSAPMTVAADLEPQVTMRTALDATHTYWTQPTGIWRSDGGAPERLTATAGAVTALALDDTDVYWIDDDGLFRLGKDVFGAPIAISTDAAAADHLAVDDQDAYWIELDDAPTIYRAPLDGSAAREVVVSERGLHDFAITDVGLYYTSNDFDGSQISGGRVMLRPRSSL